GHHLAVWADRSTGDREVFGRLVDGTGQPLGGDVQLTLQGAAGDGLGSSFPSVAWNANLDEFFVVFEAPVTGDVEIFGQRVRASDASPIDPPVRISTTLGDGDGQEARRPDVTFDTATGEYLVVWAADVTPQGEIEVVFQRVDGQGGVVGAPVQLSEQGPAGDPFHFADQPAIAYNAADDEALVVWMGSNPDLPFKLEIFAQRIAADGTELGDDIKLNTQGRFDAEDEDAFEPEVAWGPDADRYLVVWSGDSSLDGFVESEFEIYGQLVDADGTEPSPEFRISTVRGVGAPTFDASSADVAYDSTQGAFVVVWDGTGPRPTQVSGEFEIYLQTIATSGALQGPVEVLTDLGTDGDASRYATNPEIAVRGGLALVAYVAEDPVIGRGIGGQLWTSSALDIDGDGFTILTGDCNDLDATVYPGAPEFCSDAVDTNCDGVVLLLDELDVDGDGVSSCAGDCDDLDAATFPGAPELCDGFDNDCDGIPDDGAPDGDNDFICDAFDPCPQDANNDSDGDGVCDSDDRCLGDDSTGDTDGDGLCDASDSCPLDPSDDSDFDGSCDSVDLCGGDDATGDPDGDGICNDFDSCPNDPDNDADGDGRCADVDVCIGDDTAGDPDGDGVCSDIDVCPADALDDSDGDGSCDSVDACVGQDGTGDADGDGFCADTDCDDARATVFPGAPERCDGLDNACTGSLPDEEVDADGDGFAICGGDCDDTDVQRTPDAAEACDGIDNDCDGVVPLDEIDVDGDGFAACDGDCQPFDARAFPGGDEVCDGVDNDCDGVAETDEDADGFFACEECDDDDVLVNPSSYEICDDGVDNDCDDVTDEDDCVSAESGGCTTGAGSGSTLGLWLLGMALLARRTGRAR
ncbi:MAG: MopE-related protein, partial [Myxococcota bacterium]